MNNINIVFVVAITVLFFMPSIFSGCIERGEPPPFKAFTMHDGLADFTFEYNSRFIVEESYTQKIISAVHLVSPYIKEAKDYTEISVSCGNFGRSAESLIDDGERKSSSFPDYRLLDKSKIVIDNITAYRIDYMQRNLEPVDRGLTKPPIAVYREVRFDANGLNWMIDIRSDSTTAETDKPDFEHVLQTFKILD